MTVLETIIFIIVFWGFMAVLLYPFIYELIDCYKFEKRMKYRDKEGTERPLKGKKKIKTNKEAED